MNKRIAWKVLKQGCAKREELPASQRYHTPILSVRLFNGCMRKLRRILRRTEKYGVLDQGESLINNRDRACLRDWAVYHRDGTHTVYRAKRHPDWVRSRKKYPRKLRKHAPRA